MITAGFLYRAGAETPLDLVAPSRAILRYYRCDAPYRAIPFKGGWPSPKMVRYPPFYLVSQRHICAIPLFATYRAIIVRYPIKTSTKEFCDTIATSIARYEKYRYWASKPLDFREKFRVFPRTILEIFSGVDTQPAVLVSTPPPR